MRIELAGWSTSGLRCPDTQIDLTRPNGGAAQITLIQMPNGTGKTTMLQLLSAALSGSARSWSADRVLDFRRPGASDEHGRFDAHLLVDGRRLSIELTLDFVSGAASYRTTNPGSGGVVNGWQVPPSIHRFMAEEFLSLFIFDGEFADRLLDPRHHEADKSIDALCQVYLLDHVRGVAQDFWDNATRRQGPRTEAGLERLQRVEERLYERLVHIRSAREEAQTKHGEATRRLNELGAQIARRVSGVERTRESHANALAKESAAKEAVGIISTQLLAATRVPSSVHPEFARQLRTLRDSLDRLRLPENTSAQFFDELLEEVECICGRPLDDSARHAIAERSRRYLDTDEAGTLNALKRDIAEYIPADTGVEAGSQQLLNIRSALGDAVRERDTAAREVRALRAELIDAGDEELKSLQEEESRLLEEVLKLELLLGEIDGPGDTNLGPEGEVSLSRLDAELSETRARIAKITETVRLRKQTGMVQEIMKCAADAARQRIRTELVAESNRLLSTVLAQAPVEISAIDRSIRLRGQGGASVGQTLSVGYVFLLSVLQRGRNQFPLVVDSPANPLDQGVRKEIGRLIPQLANQFIGFTINTERQGFVDTIVAEFPQTALMTLFRRTDASEHLIQRIPKDNSVVTEDSILVTDRDFFFAFDIDRDSDTNAIPTAN